MMEGQTGADEEDEKGEEGVAPRMRNSPGEPTKDDIEEHCVDHGVFRDWCPHCVRGKAVAYGHRRMSKKSREVPLDAMDYMYMTERQRK